MICSIVPDVILKKLKDTYSLRISENTRFNREEQRDIKVPIPGQHDELRVLYDAHNRMQLDDNESNVLEVDYEQEHKDTHTNQELEMFDKVYDFFLQKLGIESYDNKDAVWKIFKHFGENYNNAFWNGEVFAFGDADQVFMKTFWIQDVCGHEAMHAVTEYVTALEYQGQSGALNESISDVVGICLNHFLGNNSWIVGEGIWTEQIKGRGLRNFTLEPAYDDPIIGRDNQPKHMKDLYTGVEDNGGVHINSGIINHEFYQFVQRSGKKSYVEPLNVWWKSIQKTRAYDNFSTFAYNTVQECDDHELKTHLIAAWFDVGMEIKGPSIWNFFRTLIQMILSLFGKR